MPKPPNGKSRSNSCHFSQNPTLESDWSQGGRGLQICDGHGEWGVKGGKVKIMGTFPNLKLAPGGFFICKSYQIFDFGLEINRKISD